MAFDSLLAQRVRDVVRDRPGITERRMFGGLAFLVDGRMFVGIRASSRMARVGPERHADALAMPGVRATDFTGRAMRGHVYVDPTALERDLDAWVGWCVAYVAALPHTRGSA